jgi:hypothetical protein
MSTDQLNGATKMVKNGADPMMAKQEARDKFK